MATKKIWQRCLVIYLLLILAYDVKDMLLSNITTSQTNGYSDWGDLRLRKTSYKYVQRQNTFNFKDPRFNTCGGVVSGLIPGDPRFLVIQMTLWLIQVQKLSLPLWTIPGLLLLLDDDFYPHLVLFRATWVYFLDFCCDRLHLVVSFSSCPLSGAYYTRTFAWNGNCAWTWWGWWRISH